MIYPSLKKTTKYIMRIGIDLIDLVPKNNQGINVYSENLVKGFIKFNKKTTSKKFINSNFKKLESFKWLNVSKKYFDLCKKVYLISIKLFYKYYIKLMRLPCKFITNNSIN